jgi:hypothetical protein
MGVRSVCRRLNSTGPYSKVDGERVAHRTADLRWLVGEVARFGVSAGTPPAVGGVSACVAPADLHANAPGVPRVSPAVDARPCRVLMGAPWCRCCVPAQCGLGIDAPTGSPTGRNQGMASCTSTPERNHSASPRDAPCSGPQQPATGTSAAHPLAAVARTQARAAVKSHSPDPSTVSAGMRKTCLRSLTENGTAAAVVVGNPDSSTAVRDLRELVHVGDLATDRAGHGDADPRLGRSAEADGVPADEDSPRPSRRGLVGGHGSELGGARGDRTRYVGGR